MKPSWIIEQSNIDKSYIDLHEEIQRQGMKSLIHIFKLSAMMDIDYRKLFPEDTCVVFQGGMPFALHLMKHYKWTPLAWLTLENYKCSNYYSHLGKYLLNENYVIMPSQEVFRNVDKIFNVHFPGHDEVFIRPDTGVKTLNARTHSKYKFRESYGSASIMCFPESLVIISAGKTIKEEWRFVCADKEIITGCKYKENGATRIEDGFEYDALMLAKEIAQVYQPDPMFTIDICRDGNDDFKLVEINSFSCAGLYACDIPIIVETASKIAEREWSEIYG